MDLPLYTIRRGHMRWLDWAVKQMYVVVGRKLKPSPGFKLTCVYCTLSTLNNTETLPLYLCNLLLVDGANAYSSL